MSRRSGKVFDVTTDEDTTIVVGLRGSAANVLLVDSVNLQRWRSGGSFQYDGGFFKQSPATFRPGAGKWHVIVNVPPGGGRTEIDVSVQG